MQQKNMEKRFGTCIVLLFGLLASSCLYAQPDPLFVAPGGNVGIGVLQPNMKLDVGGDIHTSTSLRADGNNFLFSRGSVDGTNNVVFRYDANNTYLYPWGTGTATNTLIVGCPWCGSTAYTNLSVAGNISTSKELIVTGKTTLSQGLSVTGDVGVTGNIALTGTHLVFNSGPGVIDWGENSAGSLYFRQLKGEKGGIGSYHERMIIDHNGNVGIGTTSPRARLEIKDYANYEFGRITFRALNKDNCFNMHNTTRSGADKVGIWTEGLVYAQEFWAFSDERIKTNLVRANPQNDLSLLNNLKVTDFQYKDFIAHGNGINRGFIAQEVEKVFPQAVTRNTEFIPDIFDVAEKLSLKDGILAITTNKPHKLATNDIVRLISDGKVLELQVKVLNEHTFTVKGTELPTDHLFVYGKKVNDFRVVDYQQLFSLGISAMQQLSKEVDALKAENEMLKKQNAANCKTISADHDELASILARLEKLEALDGGVKTAQK